MSGTQFAMVRMLILSWIVGHPCLSFHTHVTYFPSPCWTSIPDPSPFFKKESQSAYIHILLGAKQAVCVMLLVGALILLAQVEELAFLVKDNLPCKHLILSMEEALVNFLEDNSSSDRLLELEPMSSYNRLLLHRLAEIFGFSHYSVGEGDDRHLILERCLETSIPSILVSDLLWQYDEMESPRISDVLSRRKEPSAGLNMELPNFDFSLEEREAAYLVARERIFSEDDGGTRGPVKQRPPNNPVVARRMIAHALGQRIKPSSVQAGQQAQDMNIQGKELLGTNKSVEKAKVNKQNGNKSSHAMSDRTVDSLSPKLASSVSNRSEKNIEKDCLKKEHIGAAKRMFANALRFHLGDGSLSKTSELKQTNRLNLE